MSEEIEDLEFSMARIRAMKEAKKNLDREIQEEMKYVESIMRDKTELKSGSFKATVVTRTRKGAMSIGKIAEILGKEAAEKVTTVSESRWIDITEVFDDVEPFAIKPADLVPAWVHSAFKGLTGEEE